MCLVGTKFVVLVLLVLIVKYILHCECTLDSVDQYEMLVSLKF